MNVPELAAAVAEHFAASAGQFGLNPDRVEARYVLNWGGFVNPSFTVTDGSRSYHLKLAVAGDDQEALRRWESVRDILEARYHAPRMLGWVDLPAHGVGGPLFEHIDGKTLDSATAPAVIPQIVSAVGRLHADAELAKRVRPWNERGTCLDHFSDTFAERFSEDLKIIATEPPPFVSPDILRWMEEEAARVGKLAGAEDAFAEPAVSPVHEDLWEGNILVTPAGGWYLLDWDGLGVGDPAMDYALLLNTRLNDAATPPWRDYNIPDDNPALLARIGFYWRIMLLDAVIDVLADYVEAGIAPEHSAFARDRKRREHLEALALYQERYG